MLQKYHLLSNNDNYYFYYSLIINKTIRTKNVKYYTNKYFITQKSYNSNKSKKFLFKTIWFVSISFLLKNENSKEDGNFFVVLRISIYKLTNMYKLDKIYINKRTMVSLTRKQHQ